MAPIDAMVDSLDDVPEQYHDLYTETDDGRYRADINGVEFPEDVKGLKSALEKEKERRRELMDTYNGVDLDEYRRLQKEAEQREDEQAAKRGEYEKLLKKKETEWQDRLQQIETEKQALEGQVLGLVRDTEARKALAQAGANVDLLLPHVLSRVDVVVEDGQRKAVVLNEEGAPRLNDDGKELSISELVAEMAESEQYRAAFPSTVKNGGGAATDQSAGRASNSGPEFASDWDKVDFIAKHGKDAYLERIGVKSPK